MAQRRLLKAQGNPAGYDKDLIYQINECLKARDAVLDQLLAEPTIFAFGCGTTTGTGAITTLYTFGCSLEVQGTQVVARFNDRRPSDQYVYSGLFIGDLTRVPVAVDLTVKTREVCGIRYKTDTGTTWSASTQVFSTLIWAMGPRK